MSVKSDVLRLFENNREIHMSGEEIAKKLNVSRNAVWKTVKSLQKEGYDIVGVNKKGYKMSDETDILSDIGISKYLHENIKKLVSIDTFKSVDSTNERLKELAANGEKELKIIISEEQTKGRGRMNRVFYSPANTGIYMSILLRPKFPASESLFITTMAAVAVARAIEKIIGVAVSIKWVNDIYCNKKKVCGILTEASVNVENDKLDYAIVGIGINVKTPKQDFPEQIKDVATSLINQKIMENVEQGDIRCKLAAEVINNIMEFYGEFENHSFMEEYRDKSMLIGKDVVIVGDESKEPLHVIGIDDHAGLLVKHEDGTIQSLSSGEVSVRIR